MMTKLLAITLVLLGFTVQINAQKQSSLLWEISGNGLKKKSYLYGTMHVSNKIAFHLGDTFFLALDQADMVCLESDPGSWISEMYNSENMSRFSGSYNYGDGNFYEKLVKFDEPEKKDLEKSLNVNNDLDVYGFDIDDQWSTHDDSVNDKSAEISTAVRSQSSGKHFSMIEKESEDHDLKELFESHDFQRQNDKQSLFEGVNASWHFAHDLAPPGVRFVFES